MARSSFSRFVLLPRKLCPVHRGFIAMSGSSRAILEETRARHQARIYAYVLMPEHVHLLMNEPAGILVAQFLKALKQTTSRRPPALEWNSFRTPPYPIYNQPTPPTTTQEQDMPYLIGFAIAITVCLFAALTGFDRDRAFYPTVVLVVAHYYILFAVIGATMHVVLAESIAASAFIILAVVGFKTTQWITAAALAAHGVYDYFHHLIIQDPGVPAWWPAFCMSFDVLAGAIVAALLLQRRSARCPTSRF